MGGSMTAQTLSAFVVFALCSSSSLYAQPAKVAGTLTVNATKIPLQHILAVSYETPSQGRVISVLVSDKPVNPKTFQEYTRIGPGEKYVPGMVTGAWVTMHNDKELSGFSFTLRADRTLMLSDVLVGGDANRFGLTNEYPVLDIYVERAADFRPGADQGSHRLGHAESRTRRHVRRCRNAARKVTSSKGPPEQDDAGSGFRDRTSEEVAGIRSSLRRCARGVGRVYWDGLDSSPVVATTMAVVATAPAAMRVTTRAVAIPPTSWSRPP